MGGSRLRELTRDKIDSVIRQLKAGQSPKEVAATLGLTWMCVQQIIRRHHVTRCVFIETYKLRHPQCAAPPPKILTPFLAMKKASQL